jgi:hypothetical protein
MESTQRGGGAESELMGRPPSTSSGGGEAKSLSTAEGRKSKLMTTGGTIGSGIELREHSGPEHGDRRSCVGADASFAIGWSVMGACAVPDAE